MIIIILSRGRCDTNVGMCDSEMKKKTERDVEQRNEGLSELSCRRSTEISALRLWEKGYIYTMGD